MKLRVHGCRGHGTGCLLITLGLVSIVPSAGPLSSLEGWQYTGCAVIDRDHWREPGTRKIELWALLSMHIVWEENSALPPRGAELSWALVLFLILCFCHTRP